ncbi:MAG: type II toxin-antitoxin system prevent-host-death family antitoxin [Parvularculaceae bacterium]
MSKKFYTARDAAKHFGAVVEEAEYDPVVVHRHGRPHAVIIGWRRFQDYRKAYDDAFEARQVRLLELRLQAIIAGKLGVNDRLHALLERLKKGEVGLGELSKYEKDESESPIT